MLHSLKHLLRDSLHRHAIERKVDTARLIQVGNELVRDLLPPERLADARCASVRNQVLIVACANASAAQRIRQAQRHLLQELERKLGPTGLTSVQTRLSSDSTSSLLPPSPFL